MNDEEKEDIELDIEAKYVDKTEKEFLSRVTYAECLYILTPENKYCDKIKELSVLKICEILEKLQKENEKLREIKNCVVPVSVIKKWIKDREEKIEKMHPASDCVLIDDYETQIDILKKLLEDEIYDGE